MKLFFSDIHSDEQNKDQVVPALEFISGYLKQNPQIDTIFIGGDLATTSHLSNGQIIELRDFLISISKAAKTYLICGNHDWSSSSYSFIHGLVGKKNGESIIPNVNIYHSVCLEDLGDIQVLMVPYPNKYIRNTSPLEASKHLREILYSYKGKITKPSISLYHGMLFGSKIRQDISMMPDLDVCLATEDFPTDLILAGHIHNHQIINNAIYSGSIAPFTFSDANVQPKLILINDDLTLSDVIDIPVKHQLVNLVIDSVPDNKDINSFIESKIKERKVSDTNVRIVLNLSPEKLSSIDKPRIEKFLSESKPYKSRIFSQSLAMAVNRIEEFKSLNLSVPDAIRIYLKHIDKSKYIDPLIEIENGFQDEVTENKIRGFIPKSIEWENFKQLKKGSIDYDSLGNLVCISGVNTSGKSNLLDIEGFALWKRTSKNDSSSEIITHNQDECRVKYVFQSGDNLYKIERNCTLLKGQLGFYIKDGAEWKSLNCGNPTDTQKKITELVGTYEEYRSTRFSSQFDISRILNLSPSEFKTLIYELIDIGKYEERKKSISKILDKKSSDLSSLSVQYDTLSSEINSYRTTSEESRNVHNKIEYEKDYKSLNEDLRNKISIENKFRELILESVNLKSSIDRIEKELSSEIPYSQKDISDNIKKITGFESNLKELSIRCNERSSLDNQLQIIESQLKDVKNIPCSKDFSDKCILVGKICSSETRERSKSLKVSISKYNEEIKKLEKFRNDNKKEYDNLRLVNWESLWSKIINKSKLETQLSGLIERLSTTSEKIKELSIGESNEIVLSEIKDIENRLEEIHDKLLSIERTEFKLNKLSEISGRIMTIETDRNLLSKEVENLSLYSQIMGKGGIPYFLAESTIPLLQEYTNKFLKNDTSPLFVNIKTTKILKSGEDRDEINITFTDERGTFSISNASGFQRVVLGIAIRAGLSKICADFKGMRLTFLCVDEGFGSFDTANIQTAKNLLSNICKEFSKFIYITHIQEIKDLADTNIEVVQDGNFSYLKIDK